MAQQSGYSSNYPRNEQDERFERDRNQWQQDDNERSRYRGFSDRDSGDYGQGGYARGAGPERFRDEPFRDRGYGAPQNPDWRYSAGEAGRPWNESDRDWRGPDWQDQQGRWGGMGYQRGYQGGYPPGGYQQSGAGYGGGQGQQGGYSSFNPQSGGNYGGGRYAAQGGGYAARGQSSQFMPPASQSGGYSQGGYRPGGYAQGGYGQSGFGQGGFGQGGYGAGGMAGYGHYGQGNAGGYQRDFGDNLRSGEFAWGQADELRRGRAPKGFTRSDERIKEDVCERLMHAPQIDAGDVSVEVKDGKVTLEGTVPDRRMRHELEDIADSCLGVKDVDNRVRVARPDYSGGSPGMGSSSPGSSAASGSSMKK